MDFVFPAPLRPGDPVAVVSPSSPSPRDALFRGLGWLLGRYQVRASPRILERDGFLAGTDERRAAELARAMLDPEVKAIIAARGGYGATRILDALPWEAFLQRPKWLVGFSDVTALHATLWRLGVASVHAPNVTGLGRAPMPRLRMAFMEALEHPRRARRWEGLEVLVQGTAEGVVVGGNLALLEAMAAAGRLEVPEGGVLLLEDVTERPYRIDRMLTSLLLGGHLGRASAVVFGELSECTPGPDGRRVEEVIAERTKGLGVPVLAGAPFGHGEINDAFVLGARVRVDGGTVFFQ